MRPVGTAEILFLVPGVGDMKTESLHQGECVGWMAVVACFSRGIWKKRGKEKELSKNKNIKNMSLQASHSKDSHSFAGDHQDFQLTFLELCTWHKGNRTVRTLHYKCPMDFIPESLAKTFSTDI